MHLISPIEMVVKGRMECLLTTLWGNYSEFNGILDWSSSPEWGAHKVRGGWSRFLNHLVTHNVKTLNLREIHLADTPWNDAWTVDRSRNCQISPHRWYWKKIYIVWSSNVWIDIDQKHIFFHENWKQVFEDDLN